MYNCTYYPVFSFILVCKKIKNWYVQLYILTCFFMNVSVFPSRWKHSYARLTLKTFICTTHVENIHMHDSRWKHSYARLTLKTFICTTHVENIHMHDSRWKHSYARLKLKFSYLPASNLWNPIVYIQQLHIFHSYNNSIYHIVQYISQGVP